MTADNQPAESDCFTWGGFSRPNYTQVPDEFFDSLMAHLTPSELLVCLYIIRRTFGFKKESDAISLSQICNGIKRRDGTVLDEGTGLARSSAVRAVQGLERKGVIRAERSPGGDGEAEGTTIYALRFRMDNPSPKMQPSESHSGRFPSPIHRTAPVPNLNGQKTVVQDLSQETEDLSLASIAKTAAVAINQYPRRADVARQLGRLISATGATPSELARAVDRAVKRQTPDRTPDDFYAEVRHFLEIRPP